MEQNQINMIFDLKSFFAKLTVLIAVISSLSFLAVFIGMLKPTTSITDVLALLLWWYLVTPIYSIVLEILEKRVKSIFVKLGIPVYLIVFLWQLLIL